MAMYIFQILPWSTQRGYIALALSNRIRRLERHNIKFQELQQVGALFYDEALAAAQAAGHLDSQFPYDEFRYEIEEIQLATGKLQFFSHLLLARVLLDLTGGLGLVRDALNSSHIFPGFRPSIISSSSFTFM